MHRDAPSNAEEKEEGGEEEEASQELWQHPEIVLATTATGKREEGKEGKARFSPFLFSFGGVSGAVLAASLPFPSLLTPPPLLLLSQEGGGLTLVLLGGADGRNRIGGRSASIPPACEKEGNRSPTPTTITD